MLPIVRFGDNLFTYEGCFWSASTFGGQWAAGVCRVPFLAYVAVGDSASRGPRIWAEILGSDLATMGPTDRQGEAQYPRMRRGS